MRLDMSNFYKASRLFSFTLLSGVNCACFYSLIVATYGYENPYWIIPSSIVSLGEYYYSTCADLKRTIDAEERKNIHRAKLLFLSLSKVPMFVIDYIIRQIPTLSRTTQFISSSGSSFLLYAIALYCVHKLFKDQNPMNLARQPLIRN